MSELQAIILGLIQGLTEFLPVSSSGHLAIGREILGVGGPGDLTFEVTVHCATVLATIIVFRKEIWRLLSGLFKFRYNEETDYVLKICVSMIPVFIVGMFFKDFVENLFNSLLVVGVALMVTSLLLFLSERIKTSSETAETGNGIKWWQAFVIGLGQACAVIPGLSRSGTTISTGLLCGVRKDAVAQFSFLMVLVPILGETFLDVVGGGMASSTVGELQLALGFTSAFISGLFACKVMIALVKKAQLKWFALYCAVIGTGTVIYTLT